MEDQSENRSDVKRRTALKVLGSTTAAVGGITALTGSASAAMPLDVNVYTGASMPNAVPDSAPDYCPAEWVADYVSTHFAEISNVDSVSATAETGLVDDYTYSTSSASAFLTDWDNDLSSMPGRAEDANLILTAYSTEAGGIAEGACNKSDGQDASAVFNAAYMYNKCPSSVKTSKTVDASDGLSGNEIAFHKQAVAMQEVGHNIGLGHKHGLAKDYGPIFTPMIGSYADEDLASTDDCCGISNWCGESIHCIDMDNSYTINFGLAQCAEQQAYPGDPYCSGGVPACPSGAGSHSSNNGYVVDPPFPGEKKYAPNDVIDSLF